MARKHLINLHTTGTTLPSVVAPEGLRLGEIAVQHNAEHPELIIATSVENDGTFAHFIDSAATQVLINASVSGVSQDLRDLEGIVGDGFGTAGTITEIVSGLQTGSLSEISANNASDALVIVTVSEKGQGTTQTVSAAPVTVDLSGQTEGLVLASDARATIKAVDDKIGGNFSSSSTVSNAISTISGDVITLQGVVSGYSGTEAIKTAVDAAQDTATSALTTASTALQSVSHGTDGDYITVTVGTRDANKDQAISAALTVQPVSGASASAKGLAEASDVKTYVDTEVAGVSGDVTDIKTQLAGFDTTSGAVKTYVDDKVASAITSVYRVKGTVATADELPTTGQVTGDVWNITSASTYGPAGTNVVWTGNAWDALGGTVDLTPYQTVSGFTAYTSTTETTLGAITGNVNTLSSVTGDLQSVLSGYTGVGSVSADVKTAKDAAADALTGVSITGDDFVGFTAGTVANQNLPFTAAVKTHAIAGATADSDGLATAFAVKGVTDTIAEDVNTVSGTAAANSSAITALQTTVGTGFSQSSITEVVASLQAGSYEGLVSGACEYIALDLSGVDASTHMETIGVSAVTVAIADAVAGSNDGLVLASDAKAEINAVAQDVADIEAQLGSGFSSGKTVASEITRLDGAMLTGITSGTADEYVTLTVGAKSDKAQTVTVDTKVASISTATAATDGLATAFDVKDYVSGITSDVLTAVTKNSQDIATIDSELGTGFTSGSTVADQLAAVKTTADAAVQSVSVKNSATNLITATEDSTTHNVEFDFDSMVIDCGTY